jgi:hypothetical protein
LGRLKVLLARGRIRIAARCVCSLQLTVVFWHDPPPPPHAHTHTHTHTRHSLILLLYSFALFYTLPLAPLVFHLLSRTATSLSPHIRNAGITADRLGGEGYDAKGMLFGMTTRNSKSAPSLWKFWDSNDIQSTAMVGWWEDDVPVNVSTGPTPPPTPPPPPAQCVAAMEASVTHGKFPQASGGPDGNIGFGGNSEFTTLQNLNP